MHDPILRLAQQRIVSASADIEVQLISKNGCRPVLLVLLKARNEAAIALARLADLPEGATIEEVRTLQHEVKRYADILEWFRDVVREGISLDREISNEDREEMVELLTQTPEGQEEAIELGLVERNPNAHDA